MRRILVPPRPGAFSALGLLCTDVVHDYIRSELRPLAEVAPDHAEDIFRQLEAKAREELAAEGMDAAPMRVSCASSICATPARATSCARRSTDCSRERLTPQSLAAARERFDERHAQIHGHAAKERPVEVVSYRLRAARRRAEIPAARRKPRRHRRAPIAAARQRAGARVHFDGSHGRRRRSTSATGSTSAPTSPGPAIVEQFDATTVIPPGWRGAGRRLSQSDPGERRDHGRHHHPDPAQQDREPGRGDALPFLSLRLFHHHPRVARLQLRDPRPRRAADRGAADVLPRAGLPASGRPHPRSSMAASAAPSTTATCSSPTILTRAACRMSPTWRSSRRCSPTARSSPSAGSIAHKADVGGAVPGSTSANATEMFHEGLLMPPIKIVRRRQRAARHRAHHPRPTAGSRRWCAATCTRRSR